MLKFQVLAHRPRKTMAAVKGVSAHDPSASRRFVEAPLPTELSLDLMRMEAAIQTGAFSRAARARTPETPGQRLQSCARQDRPWESMLLVRQGLLS